MNCLFEVVAVLVALPYAFPLVAFRPERRLTIKTLKTLARKRQNIAIIIAECAMLHEILLLLRLFEIILAYFHSD